MGEITAISERGKSLKEASPSDVVISGEEVVEIFGSKSCQSEMRRISRKIQQTPYDAEAEFTIYRNRDGSETALVRSTSADFYSVGKGEKDLIKEAQLLQSGNFPILHLHFHPFIRSKPALAYTPSAEDLLYLQFLRAKTQIAFSSDSSPLGMIALIKDANDMDILVYQQNPGSVLSQDLVAAYRRDIASNENSDDIQNLLADYNFKAAMLDYRSNMLTLRAQRKLKTFGFLLSPNKP